MSVIPSNIIFPLKNDSVHMVKHMQKSTSKQSSWSFVNLQHDEITKNSITALENLKGNLRNFQELKVGLSRSRKFLPN